MSALHSASESVFSRPGVRLRVGLLMSAGVVILFVTVVGISVYFSEMVTWDDDRLRCLDHLQHQLTQPDAVLATSATFEPIARALLEGGQVTLPQGDRISLPPIDEAVGRETMARVLSSWDEWRHAQAEATLSTAPSEERVTVARERLQNSLAEARRQIATRRAEGIGMVRGMYATLFLSSLVLLVLGLWLLQQNIVAPVEQLQHIAQRIAKGDLDTPVALSGQGEFLDLSRSFEMMRRELQRSRDRMQQWTQELQAHVAKRTQQLGALSEVIATASRSLELDTVLRTALEQSLAVIDARIGAIWLLSQDTSELHLTAAQNLPTAIATESRVLQLGEGVTGRAAQTGQTIVLEDIAQHPGPIKAVAIREGIRSIVAVPIRLRERVLGVLDVMLRQPRTFNAEELTLLTSIGQQIGIAVESWQLMQAIQRQTQEMAAWRERERIGIELHDGVLQTLSYLYLQTDQLALQATQVGANELASKLQTQRDLLGELAREIRRFVSDLRDVPPRAFTLQTALREMVRTLGNNHLPQIHLDFSSTPIELDPERGEHLVRLAREALLNAVRHSHAQNIYVRLTHSGDQVILTIQDDGYGFDPAQVPETTREHFGLSIMQARAARIGGTLTIQSSVGQGTCVQLIFTL